MEPLPAARFSSPQLRDLGDVRLPVEVGMIRIQTERHPRRSDFESRAADPVRVLVLRQRMVVRKEVEVLRRAVPARLDAGTDCAHKVADVRRPGRRDAREIDVLAHAAINILPPARPCVLRKRHSRRLVSRPT